MKTISAATIRRISVAALRAAAKLRPEGYFEEVTAAGRVDGNVILLTDEAYQSLRRKFSAWSKPSLPEKTGNAAAAAMRAASAILHGKKVIASAEEQERRMAICTSCEFFTGTTCRKCGCVAKFKTKLATETCPIGKW